MVHVYPDTRGEYFSTNLRFAPECLQLLAAHGYAVLFANTMRIAPKKDANLADAVGIERP